MNFQKLRKLDSECAGVTIPRDDLRYLGLVDEEGNLVEQPLINVNLVEDGKWEIQLVNDDFTPLLESQDA